MKLFDSNQAPFFTVEEKSDYQQFLGTISPINPYFIVEHKGRVVAAGGYAVENKNQVRFTWGMVNRQSHGAGIGKFLVEQRLNLIQSQVPNATINLDTSQHTVGFYKARGFKVLSKQLDGYGDKLHKIEMVYAPDEVAVEFDSSIELIANGMHLIPYQAKDFEQLYKVASDPAIWAQHPANDRYQRSVFKHYFDSGLSSGMAYLVGDTASNKIIGSSRYHQPDFITSTVEIGWTFLAANCWGGVMNAKLKDLMIRHAFDYFDTVHFCIGKNNQRSIKAVNKLGAIHKPELYEAERAGSVWYGLTAQSYVGRTNYGQ